MRSGGWRPHEWDSSFYKRGQRALCYTKKTAVREPGRSFTRHRIGCHPDCGLSSLQNFWEISVCGLSHSGVYGVVESMVLNPAAAAAAAAKSLQSCLTLCDPIDGSPPGSPVPGILQARTLEWVAIAFSNAWTWKVKVKSLSRVWLLQPTRLLRPWDFPGKSTGVGCHCLLQYWTLKEFK